MIDVGFYWRFWGKERIWLAYNSHRKHMKYIISLICALREGADPEVGVLRKWCQELRLWLPWLNDSHSTGTAAIKENLSKSQEQPLKQKVRTIPLNNLLVEGSPRPWITTQCFILYHHPCRNHLCHLRGILLSRGKNWRYAEPCSHSW